MKTIEEILDEMLESIGLNADDLIRQEAERRIDQYAEEGILNIHHYAQKSDHVDRLIDQQYSDYYTEDIVNDVFGNIDGLADEIERRGIKA